MSEAYWLERWLPHIGAPSPQRPILELGCGFCDDTVYLERSGYRVIAADLAADRLSICTQNVQRAALLRLDLRSPLPFSDDSFPVIVASLCLHYFPWDETVRIVQEVRRCLTDDGLLLCRINSTNDVNFGAVGHPLIDPNLDPAYYQVGDRRKRFFDEQSVRDLFAVGWAIESLQEQTITRYERPKAIWKAALRIKPTA